MIIMGSVHCVTIIDFFPFRPTFIYSTVHLVLAKLKFFRKFPMGFSQVGSKIQFLKPYVDKVPTSLS